MRGPPHSALAAFALPLVCAGCYASHTPPDGGGCHLPEELITIERQVWIGGYDGRPAEGCVLEGHDRTGAQWTMRCTRDGCDLLRGGTSVCHDDTLDPASTCGNGFPTAAGLRIWNWRDADVTAAERR